MTASNLEAEQAIIGAILFDNQLLDQIKLEPWQFHEPLHARIFETCQALHSTGRLADPLTVGISDQKTYMVEMVVKCPAPKVALSYVPILQNLWKRRELVRLGKELAADVDDPEAVIEGLTRELDALQSQTSNLELVSAAEAVNRVETQLDGQTATVGVSTGLEPIDAVSGGFMPGELWLGAGRPGMGKSAVANCAALHVARSGLGVIEINCEMTVEQMMRRHICDLAYEKFEHHAPTYSQVRKRLLSVPQRDAFKAAAHQIRKLGTLKSIYRTGLTMPMLAALIRRQAVQWAREGVKLGLVTVDHVGLIKASTGLRSRTEAQGEVAREMKELAGQIGAPILALVQLNRQVEGRDDKRPMLADLRDSGEWEENADGVIAFYRPAYYAQRENEPKGYNDKLLWEERRQSRHIDAMFLKIREGEMQTVKLWADMGRNAIRGADPAHGDRFEDLPFD